MLWHAFDKIARLLEGGGLAVPGSSDRMTVEQFADRLLAASTPSNYELPAAVAIDGTDLEAWARRRSWANKKSGALRQPTPLDAAPAHLARHHLLAGQRVCLLQDRDDRTRSGGSGTPAATQGHHRLGYRLLPTIGHRIDQRRGQEPPAGHRTRVHPSVRHRPQHVARRLRVRRLNVRILRDWHAKRRLADPWATYLGEPDLGDGPKVAATRPRRRTRALADLLDRPPPDRDVKPGPEGSR